MRTRHVGIVLSLVLSAGLLATPAQAAGDGPSTIGAAGIGDRYFPKDGNGGYRVGHYTVRVAYDHPTRRLTGRSTVVARTTQRLTRFNLDLMLRASKVEVDGRPARFTQDSHELVVTPATALRKDQKFEVTVTYAGVPERLKRRGEKAWFTTANGAIVLNEPQGAAWWYPSNDHPSDKATFDIEITVPRGTKAVSNGRLVSTRPSGSSATWHWQMRQPMATYLAFAAIGDYDILSGRKAGRSYLYAIDNGLSAKRQKLARQRLEQTPRVTNFLARKFGAYPFDVVGGVVTSADVGFALENQTRPIYDAASLDDPLIVPHEMAHQWFGDDVAVKRWKHIWLNEGYATYAEWLYGQATTSTSVQDRFDRFYRLKASNSFWDRKIGSPGRDHLFDDPIYYRGAMTLHALRKRIGAKDFTTLSKRWHARNSDGLGTTREYIDLAEKISGRDLDPFFRQWLFSSRKPTAVR